MEGMKLQSAIKTTWAFISRANKYIDETMPWALAKDAAKKQELTNTLYNLAESLRRISVLIEPFMPETAAKIWRQLGIAQDFSAVRLADVRAWGGFPAGTHVASPEQLFPRIEVTEEKPTAEGRKGSTTKSQEPQKKQKAEKAKHDAPADGIITIEEFRRVDLRVAEILRAERVPDTEKLMRLTVSLGDEEREIVSGIAEFYTAEELVGKKIILVANLKPAKIRGIRSHGMLLCAKSEGSLTLVEVDAPAGSAVS